MPNSKNQAEICEDEKLMILHVIQNINLNQPITEVPQHLRPPSFDFSRFQAAYLLFCLAICPRLNIPFIEYYHSIKFTDEQSETIRRWINWYEKATHVISKEAHDSDRKAQKIYYEKMRKKEKEFDLAKRKNKPLNGTQSGDTWGRTKKPKMEDDGNAWREQE